MLEGASLLIQGEEDSKRTVSMSESVASTITAASEESMSSDDDDNGEDNGESSDTASAPSPAPLLAPGNINHDTNDQSMYCIYLVSYFSVTHVLLLCYG